MYIEQYLMNALSKAIKEIYNKFQITNKINLSKINTQKFSEETLTELFLAHLKEHSDNQFVVHEHSKVNESKSGIDMEIWIVSLGKNTRLIYGLGVQAKVLDIIDHKMIFHQLFYKNKNADQTELLVNYCERMSIFPLYLLYTFWDKNIHKDIEKEWAKTRAKIKKTFALLSLDLDPKITNKHIISLMAITPQMIINFKQDEAKYKKLVNLVPYLIPLPYFLTLMRSTNSPKFKFKSFRNP